MEWAPDTVQSHLQEYINSVRIEGIKIHAGVTLATECIQRFSTGGTSSRADNTSISSTQNVRRITQIGVGSDSSRFQLRYHSLEIEKFCPTQILREINFVVYDRN